MHFKRTGIEELIVKNETKFPHINGAKRLAYITGYCDSKERFEEADAAISKLYNAAKGATDTGFNLDTYQLVDHDAYVAEFGCEPCGRAHRLDVIFIGALRLGLEKEGGKRVVDGLTRKVLQLLGDHGLALYI